MDKNMIIGGGVIAVAGTLGIVAIKKVVKKLRPQKQVKMQMRLLDEMGNDIQHERLEEINEEEA